MWEIIQNGATLLRGTYQEVVMFAYDNHLVVQKRMTQHHLYRPKPGSAYRSATFGLAPGVHIREVVQCGN